MSVAKIIEISAESTESFEDAVRQGIRRAARTVTGIKGAWVEDQLVDVSGGEVALFRVRLKVTFVLED